LTKKPASNKKVEWKFIFDTTVNTLNKV